MAGLNIYQKIAYIVYTKGKRMVITTDKGKTVQVLGLPVSTIMREDGIHDKYLYRFMYFWARSYIKEVNGERWFFIREDWLNGYIKLMEDKGLIPKR